jgi:putative transposase
LSHRDIEDLLAERGIAVSCEAIRLWCIKFGAIYARRLKRKHRGYGDTFYINEVFVKDNGKQYYLWRAVDQDGELVDVYLQVKRDGAAAKRFFKRLLRRHGDPGKIVTDKKQRDDRLRVLVVVLPVAYRSVRSVRHAVLEDVLGEQSHW